MPKPTAKPGTPRQMRIFALLSSSSRVVRLVAIGAITDVPNMNVMRELVSDYE